MREPKRLKSAIEEDGRTSERQVKSDVEGVSRRTFLDVGFRSSYRDTGSLATPKREQANDRRGSVQVMCVRTQTFLLLGLLLGISMLPGQMQAQTGPNSNPAPNPAAVDSDSPSWLFPLDKLNQSVPQWLHIGGEYRDRLEGPMGT